MDLVKKTPAELQTVFNKQIKFLTKFCNEFDLGYEDMSIMIAGVLRTLLYDSTNSNSLLGLLGGKSVNFIDTSLRKDRFSGYIIPIALPRGKDTVNEYYGKVQEMVYRDKHPYSGLCMKYITIDDSKKINAPRFYALFRRQNFKIDVSTRRVSFEEWWDGIVLDDFAEGKVTRKELVKIVADTDGYAHVDAKFNPKYEAYKKPPQINLGYFEDRISGTYENTPVSATLRQIAFEILYTIHNELPQLIDHSIPNIDFTPIGFKLTFEVTIESEEKERLVIAAIFSQRPFIQRFLISSHYKDDPNQNKTFMINAIMPSELEKILDSLKRKNIEIRNIKKEDL